jgi:hypothetical protein
VSRIRRTCFALLALVALALALPAASQASCGFLGLFPCPGPPQSAAVNPDGSLEVTSNPYDLEALPSRTAEEPLYPRLGGHMYFGIADNGVDEGTASVEEVASMAESLGASFVRINLYWPSAEYQRDAYTWQSYDQEYLTFIRHGVRPLWAILHTPGFAAGTDASCTGRADHYCYSEPENTPDALGELEEFGHDLATRYPLAAGFEYRNEPNLDTTGKCPEDDSWRIPPADYSRNLLRFAEGIRSADPDMRVLGGALAGCREAHGFADYLSAMLDADAYEGMDGLSVHLAGGMGAHGGLGPELSELAAVLRAHDEEDMRVVAGEMGYNGAEATQTQWLQGEYNALNTQDPALELVDNYDMFAGFVLVERKDKGPRNFGWVKRKFFGQFQAKQVFCDFRALLGAGRPLPSNVRNCLFG